MRFYNKKIIRNFMRQMAESKQETRDGILWDVLPAQRLARVKIQGSNQLIVAYYPENWEKTPTWLKPGNAVKIMHTQGIRGRIEVIGHGQLVPTPISDIIPPDPDLPPAQFPTVAIGENAILTGCNLIECATPRMAVLVTVGTYRIGGVTHILGPITMEYGDDYQLGDGGAMGSISGAVGINAAPSTGLFRYDLIYLGTDGVIYYLPGTPAATPVKPSLPSGLELGYVFVPSGTTEILNGINIVNTNIEFGAPVASSLLITITDNDLAWDELTTNVRVSVLDQYGGAIVGSGYGWYIQLQVASNNGTVSSAEEGSSRTVIGGHCGTQNYYDFTYTRDQLGNDYVLLTANLFTTRSITASATITLRDYSGGGMGSGTKVDPYKINKTTSQVYNGYIPENSSDGSRGSVTIPMGAKIYFEVDPLATTGLSVDAFKVCVKFYSGAGVICKLTQEKATGDYSAEVCVGSDSFMEIVYDNTPLEMDDYRFLYAIDNTLGGGAVNDEIWAVIPFVP